MTSFRKIVRRKNAVQARRRERVTSMPAPRIMMPAPRIKFSALRRIRLDLGFQRIPVAKPQIGFWHEEADLPLSFPLYRSNSIVAPHHLIAVRVLLDGFGILAADDFDRLVIAAAPYPPTNRHSASAPSPGGQIRRRKA
jgi:hypothetical protein